MKVEQHISQLLYRYPCVIVPGFGAFLASTQSAQLNTFSHSFYPPKTIVSFNSYLRHNDGLLANHISKSEKKTYEQALEIISNEISLWKQVLEINGRFYLKNIGDLTLNKENQLVFKPYEPFNYLKDAFGLTSFVSPVVQREESAVLQLVKQPEAEQEEDTVIPLNTKNSRFKIYKYAAVALLALSVGGIVGGKYYQNQAQIQSLAVETQLQKQVEQQIQTATFVLSADVPSVTLQLQTPVLPYHVVAGAFRQEENAIQAVRTLIKNGYSARKLAANNYGLHQVIYGSYPTYLEAYHEMLKIKQTANPDAWLLIKE